MNDSQVTALTEQLKRIADNLEGNAPVKTPKWSDSYTWLWQAQDKRLKPVINANALPLELLIGLEQQADILRQNTQQFADGFAANNALMWGARGMGKSSIVKSIHQSTLNSQQNKNLHLIEIYREDINTLPNLLDTLRDQEELRFILFCDDLSFDENDSSYKSLKAVLDGGIEGRPKNVILYATSNRRHLLPRKMIENERSTAIHKSESVEEKVSLSDRFGLWLGFYGCNQDTYIKMIESYTKHYELDYKQAEALEWAITRGNRSGRVAWQFIQHIAGIQGKSV